jgi:dihydroxy-acid dehydratase
VFGTPTISDGMAMGTEGMKYSLVSREVISDCVETCVNGQWMDGVLVIGGCDKNMPGGMMGMLRANVPAIYVYGGTILPGKWKGAGPEHRVVFEAVGQFSAGNMKPRKTSADRNAAPSPAAAAAAACTPPTPCRSAFEALGMSLPYASTHGQRGRREVATTRHGIRQGAGRGRQEQPEATRHRHQARRSRTPWR